MNKMILSMTQNNHNDSTQSETGGQTIVQTKPTVRRPPLYKVILLNDDYTPMDFVVGVLKRYFSKNESDAQRVMLEIHHKGAGLAGIYPFELAETKVYQVNEYSRGHRFPLKCIMEKEEQDDVKS